MVFLFFIFLVIESDKRYNRLYFKKIGNYKKKKNQTQIQIKKKQENPPQKNPQKKQNNKLTRKAKITTTNKRTTSRFNICQSPDTKLCNEIQEYILYSPASEIKRDYFFFYPVLGDCLHYH